MVVYSDPYIHRTTWDVVMKEERVVYFLLRSDKTQQWAEGTDK